MNDRFLKRMCVSSVFIVLMVISAWANPTGKDWLPVTPEELQLKDCPGMPGASAVCLFRESYYNSVEILTKIYRRIKILTPEGRKYANVEIMFLDGVTKIEDLRIRTIKPDGTIKPFNGQIFKKTAIGKRDLKMMVETFSIPDLDVGDIIEYRYTIKYNELGAAYINLSDLSEILKGGTGKVDFTTYDGGSETKDIYSLFAYRWDIDDDDLYTLKARFIFMPLSVEAMWALYGYPMRTIWTYQKLNGALPKVNKDKEIELEISNVPPFIREAFMRPGTSERMAVKFYYYNRDIDSLDNFWAHEIETWRKGVKKFIGDIDDFSGLAGQITSGAADPLEKTKKIYEWAQQLNNLSYESNLTYKQWKEKKYKDNEKVSHVIKHKYGYRGDITRAFVALARAAKLDAQVIRVCKRDSGFFYKNIPDFFGQFDSEVAIVTIDGKEIFLDPGTPFCPFGLVYWPRSYTAGVHENMSNPEFFSLPNYSHEMGLTRREMLLSLDIQGNLKGTVKVSYSGQEAINWRLSAIGNDDAGRKKNFEDDLVSLLPNGSKVTLQKIENIDNNQPILPVSFDVVIPNMVTSVGQKMLLPLSLFGNPGEHPFKHDERKYPVYFSYPFQEFDDIKIALPAAFKPESIPNPGKVEGDFAAFSLKALMEDNNTLHIQRDFQMKANFFDTNRYQVLKTFYDMVAGHDGQQLILTRSANETKH